jgi:hypothetical protein
VSEPRLRCLLIEEDGRWVLAYAAAVAPTRAEAVALVPDGWGLIEVVERPRSAPVRRAGNTVIPWH